MARAWPWLRHSSARGGLKRAEMMEAHPPPMTRFGAIGGRGAPGYGAIGMALTPGASSSTLRHSTPSLKASHPTPKHSCSTVRASSIAPQPTPGARLFELQIFDLRVSRSSLKQSMATGGGWCSTARPWSTTLRGRKFRAKTAALHCLGTVREPSTVEHEPLKPKRRAQTSTLGYVSVVIRSSAIIDCSACCN